MNGFEWLEKGIADKSSWVVWMELDPKFDPFRKYPRFDVLLKKRFH